MSVKTWPCLQAPEKPAIPEKGRLLSHRADSVRVMALKYTLCAIGNGILSHNRRPDFA